jgi:hypothetical protein
MKTFQASETPNQIVVHLLCAGQLLFTCLLKKSASNREISVLNGVAVPPADEPHFCGMFPTS